MHLSQLEHSLAGERLVRCALLVNRWGGCSKLLAMTMRCWQGAGGLLSSR